MGTLKLHSNVLLYVIQQYGHWYTGRCWLAVTFGTVRRDWMGWGPALSLLTVPNVAAHPSTASVPTSYYLMWHYNCLWTLKMLTKMYNVC